MLSRLQQLIQIDVGGRGLATDSEQNLFNACPEDLANACRSLATTPDPRIAVVTGFYVPRANPPAAETDGPLGAIYLARALVPLGMKMELIVEEYCRRPLEIGLEMIGLASQVPIRSTEECDPHSLTHLLALERVGPSHHRESISAQDPDSLDAFCESVPESEWDHSHNVRGENIDAWSGEAHGLFEQAHDLTTIGIGDGGNEIGMGKIPWRVIAKNVPGGALSACRIATDHLIVAGVSNWGAYALALGTLSLLDVPVKSDLLDVHLEQAILEKMVREGPLVDGIKREHEATVDGLAFADYVAPLTQAREWISL